MTKEEIEGLEIALTTSPDNVALIMHVGMAWYKLMDYNKAEKHFVNAARLDPNNREAKFKLGNCYFLTGRVAVAIILFEEMTEIERERESGKYYCKALLKDGVTGKARDLYEDLVANFPDLEDEELDSAFRVSEPIDPVENLESNTEILDDSNGFLEKPDIAFKDVGGLDNVKKEISVKIINAIKNPEIYKAYGKKVGGGILLYGPPGCGKTFMAKATAGEINANFINIGISDVLDMWIGKSEKKLHEIFEIARKNKPCVLFFDEIDALGSNRADMVHASSRHMINQFLSELDGIESDNDGILVLGATNSPWHLDPAFRRPGRFDRIIFVGPPDLEGRKAILDLIIADKPNEGIDTDKIARKTESFSGADLQAVLNIAIEIKIEKSMETGALEPLTTKDLLAGVKSHRATTGEWFSSAKNHAVYANDSGLYDDILDYLKIKK